MNTINDYHDICNLRQEIMDKTKQEMKESYQNDISKYDKMKNFVYLFSYRLCPSSEEPIKFENGIATCHLHKNRRIKCNSI